MLHAHCALLVGTTILVLVAALPVKVPTPAPPAPELNSTETNLLYDRYLQEVVNTLETDPEFREKLGKADAESIRNGDIAHHLEFVSHHVRTKLDEIKRIEMDRLRSYVEEQYRMQNNIDEDHLKIAEHIDHENPHTFEIADLKKLILKTTSDLAEADKLRREEFKHYELQKEFEKQEELRHLNEQERIKKQEELKQLEEQHNKHEKIHYPGNKAQLEEVWEKQDHMDPEDFDPKTFFMIHDVDSNGFWDENEVKALFIKELDKMYETGHKEDDPKEREEEMERMREQVFNSADLNKDNLISLEEFLLETRQNEFKEDPNWNTVDNTPQFTHEEYLAYEREQQEHVKKLIAEGKLPPHANMPYGSYDGSNDINHGQPGQQQPPHYQQQQQQQQYQQQQQHDYQQQQYQQQQLNNQHAINQQQPPAVQQQQQQQPPQVVQQQPQVVQQQQQPQFVQQQQQPQVVQQQQQAQVVQQQQQPQVVQQQQQPQVVQQQQQPQVVQQQQQQQPPVVQQQQQQFQQPPPVVQQQQNPPPAAPAQPKPVPQKQPPPPSANHV